ncbi:unnamed protein product [Aphanomyces euteiches]
MWTTAWTASASFSAPIQGLKLGIPGRIFVSRNASLDVPVRAVVQSDSHEVLRIIQWKIDEEEAVDGTRRSLLSATLAPSKLELIDAIGSFVIDIALRDPVHQVTTSAETILTTGTLVNAPNESVDVRSYDSSKVFIESSDPIQLDTLTLETKDLGLIQLRSPIVNITGQLSLVSKDNGAIAIQSEDIVLDGLSSNAKDGGAVYVTANNLFQATHMFSKASDCGSINIYPRGQCQDSSIHASETGRVNVGSVACETVDARLKDAGDAIVQAVLSLKTKTSDGGSIQYFNSTPTLVLGKRGRHKRSSRVAETRDNKFDRFSFLLLPPHEPSGISVLFNRGDEIYIPNYGSFVQPPVALASTFSRAGGYEGVALLGALCVMLAIGFAVMKIRRRRQGYSPVLH